MMVSSANPVFRIELGDLVRGIALLRTDRSYTVTIKTGLESSYA